jgi:hypothetical protein
VIHKRIAIAVLAGPIVIGGVVTGFGQTGEHAAGPKDGGRRIAGVWRGNSVCQVKDSPCHDETNVYRITAIAGKAGAYSVSGSKVVDGKEIGMGSSEWHYDAAKHELVSSMPAATLRFIVDGDKMDGTLTLLQGTVYRKIHLVKGK